MSSTKKVHRVFAYGTLKKGQFFHEKYLGGQNSVFCGPATASLDYSLYIDGMPRLVAEKTDKPVRGELYEVDSDVLKTLECLEGNMREIIEVYDKDGNRKLAWAWLFPAHFKGKQFAWKEEEFE